MSSTAAETEAPSDAELISRVRAGDVAAYGVLFERHREAAKRMARQLVRGPDVDDLISEAFTKVLVVLQRGSGPDVAFRAYLLTSIRRLHVDRARASQRVQVTDDLDTLDQDVEFSDPAMAGFERGAASQAFRSLPERWQLVLWHLEVEGQKPADIAPLLGMSANSVAALAYRAREGLRQAYLQSHLADTADDTCRWTTEHLGAYVRGGLAKRDSAKVSGHLEECRRCTALYLELTEVNSNLAGLLAPAILGAAAAPGYLAAAAGGGKLWLLLLTPWTKLKDAGAAAQTGAAAAAVAAVVAVAAVAGGLGGDDEPKPSEQAQSQPAEPNDAPPDDSSQPDQPPPDEAPPDTPPEQEEPPPDEPPDEPPEEKPPEDEPPEKEPETAPDAPTEFAGDVSGAGVVSLRWSPVPGARGYRVYRSSSDAAAAPARTNASASTDATTAAAVTVAAAAPRPASGKGEVITGGLITRTSYRDTSLVDGQHYRYTVTAVDQDGRESPVSKPVEVTYDPAPSTPVTPRATERADGVEVSWDENDEPDLDGYQVLRDGRPVGGVSPRSRLVDDSAVDGESYEYAVVAVDRGGQESDPSTAVDATYDPVPAAPEGVEASVRGRAVALRWDGNDEPDLRRYQVYRDGESLGGTTRPRLVDDAVVDGESYEYAVVAVDRGGQESPRSADEPATYDPDPAAPDWLRAAVGDGTITLSWSRNDEPDLDGYAIRRDGETIATVTGTTYTDKQVEDGSTYAYEVVAIDRTGNESATSNTVRETWDPAPGSPDDLDADERADHIALTWDAGDEPDLRRYRVLRDGEPIATVDEPAYDDADVTDGETYRYAVVSIDRAGQESERSETVEETYDPAPEAPVELRAEAGDASIELSWRADAEPDLEKYAILRDGDEIGSVEPGGPYEFSDTEVEDGTTYTYRVVAVDASGQKASSEPVDASWDPAPDAPTHLVAVEADASIELTWTPNLEPDVDAYLVRRDGEDLATVDASNLPSYVDRSVEDGTTYRYRVLAVDAQEQESAPSNTAAESWDPAPDAPTNLVATEADASIELTWDENTEPDLARYAVLRDGVRIATVDSPGYTDTDLEDGGTYTYTVVAIDAANQCSPPSNVATGSYDPRPSAPVGLVAGEGRSSIELSWSPNGEPDLRGYVVLRDGEPVSGTVHSVGYVDRTAAPGLTYRYRVVAVDRSGQRSAQSEAVSGSWSAPATPTGLNWNLDGSVLELFWTDNPEPDLAYYRVWLDHEYLGRTTDPLVSQDGHTGRVTHTLRVVAVDSAGNTSSVARLRFTHPYGERTDSSRLEDGSVDEAPQRHPHGPESHGPVEQYVVR